GRAGSRRPPSSCTPAARSAECNSPGTCCTSAVDPSGWSSSARRSQRRARAQRARRLSLLRPYDTLFFLCDRLQTFIEEPLNPRAVVRLGRVQVAFRVDGEIVDAVELSRLPSAVAERR